MYDIITFGSATRDIVVKPKNLTVLKYNREHSSSDNICFPWGSKIDVEEIMFTSGGGGTNTAATFSRQGLKTAFYGSIGQDLSGQEVLNELKKFKIDTRFVSTIKEKATNRSVVILSGSKDRTILAYRGASEIIGKSGINWNKINAKWIYLAPLSGEMCSSFKDIVDFAKKNKIKIAVNPGIAQLGLKNIDEILQKIDVLLLNREEASFLTKIPYDQEKEIFDKIDQICPGITVMTKGADGVVVSDGKYIYSAKSPAETNIVDTTGAGDSFASGFVSELVRGKDIESAMQLGMANSQGCLSKFGAKNGLLKKGQDYKKVEISKEEK